MPSICCLSWLGYKDVSPVVECYVGGNHELYREWVAGGGGFSGIFHHSMSGWMSGECTVVLS